MENRSVPFSQALGAWAIIIVLETVHGIVRQLWIAPRIGDLPARQWGVLIGSLLIFIVAVATSRWIGARSTRQQLGVGLLWVVLTLAFELALGMLLGLSRQRMLEDYDLTRGGLMGLGLAFMLVAPWLAARARTHGVRAARGG